MRPHSRGKRLAPRIVGDDDSDVGQTLLLTYWSTGASVHRSGREAGAEHVPAVRGEGGLGARLDQERRHLQLLGQRGDGASHRAGDDAADGDHPFLDQPLVAGRADIGIVGRVLHDELDHPAVDPAGVVDLLRGQHHPVASVDRPGGETGQVGQNPDPDRLAGCCCRARRSLCGVRRRRRVGGRVPAWFREPLWCRLRHPRRMPPLSMQVRPPGRAISRSSVCSSCSPPHLCQSGDAPWRH